MDWATSEVVTVLAFLLPGFVAVIIFYSLTSHPKPDDLERVVQALAFTITSQAISSVIVYLLDTGWSETRWPEFERVVLPFAVAILLGIVAVLAANHDFPHGLLRQVGITRETSFPSELYGAFAENNRHYVVLHLKNGNRLYGWPEEWPSRPDQGHFRLSECQWLVDDEQQELTGVSVLLVPAQNVDMIEFMRAEQLDAREEE